MKDHAMTTLNDFYANHKGKDRREQFYTTNINSDGILDEMNTELFKKGQCVTKY